MIRFIFVLIFLGGALFGQTYRVTYNSFFEGKKRENQDSVLLYAGQDISYITTQNTEDGSKKIPYELQKTDWKTGMLSQFAFLKDHRISAFTAPYAPTQKFELKNDTKKILGYLCHKAVTTVNSNTIEIWYTNDLPVKGAPTVLGQHLGLVLETIRNGSAVTRAVDIKKVKTGNFNERLKGRQPEIADELTYKDLLWRSRFTTIPVFQNETVNFIAQPQSDENTKRFANGTVILRKIKFPKIAAGDNIFAELTQQSSGDAYDRTGTVFMIPQNKEKSFFNALSQGIVSVPGYEVGDSKVYKGFVATENYEPPLELMRFFTPFGIHQFNSLKLKDKVWQDKASYRQDITELQPQLSEKEVWVGVYIGNYDKGGHKLSLEITVHEDGINVWKNNSAMPLFNTTNIMEMAGQTYATLFGSQKGLSVSFNLAKDLKNAQLRYISTGHGGWENGDEFVPKVNKVSLDGAQVHAFIPWRTECGSYRLYNPASGNFSNGLSSSDYSRSNWCPGTVTNPVFIPLGDLKAGSHNITIQIPQGSNEGSSFSYWNVSGVLLGTE